MSEQEIPPELAEAMRKFLTDMANGVCPVCQMPVTEKKQVGRCVYERAARVPLTLR